jgi:tetratricopeptide (TPR) repeat protein
MKPNTPNDKDDYLKIAIFGGSSAIGFGSEAHLGNILALELDWRYSDLNFHVANHAVVGYPFHRHQAELLKAYIEQYDIFLIYTGHNEAHNYLDDIGYFRPPELRGQRGLQPLVVIKSGAVAWLKSSSWIYAITKSISRKHTPSFIQPRLPNYAPTKHAEFESTKALPPGEMVKIFANFEKDLKAIGELADAKGKTVIISSVTNDLSYPPYFSAHKSGLTQEDLELFNQAYERGLTLFDDGRFHDSIASFLEAAEVDQNVAVLNYWLGRSYAANGDTDQSRKYLVKGVDEDGLPIRIMSPLNRIAEETARDYSSVHFVDSVQETYMAIDSGIESDNLFVDYIHPSLTGHAILAQTFLRKLAEIEPLNEHPTRGPLLDFKDSSWVSSLTLYEEKFANSPSMTQRTNLNAAIYHWSLSRLASNPEVFSKQALESINRWIAGASEDSANQATLLLFRSLVAANETNVDLAIILANQAATLAPKTVQDLLYKQKPVSGVVIGNWIYPLNESGLDYHREDNEFTMQAP